MNSKSGRRRVQSAVVFALTVSATLFPGTATAAESDNWQFRITPYLWMLGLDGTTAALGQDVDVDASFSDIVDVLNIHESGQITLAAAGERAVFVVFGACTTI